jgi:omega-6 fatty acid desaturase (delta-12 desaturase)
MSRLSPSNAIGASIVAGCGLLTAAGLALSAADQPLVWLAGQIVLAIALMQWFIVLHEAGHFTLFASRAGNTVAGHLAGFLALIPFESWRRVHGLHHRWTGWQDLDPTTASLVPRPLKPAERFIIDWAWRLWLPLFSTLYRLNNYWHLPRISRLFGAAKARRAMAINAVLLAAAYGALALALGPSELLRYAGLALVLSLALQDPLILSQHTHVPQNVSGGREVTPFRPGEQERYTRSLRFPRWIAAGVLFNFDAHELHHGHAHVPGYRLRNLAQPQENEVHWWTWLRAAKRLPGSVFLFSNRDATGFRL